MKPPVNRRTLLTVAGSAAIAAVAQSVAAQAKDLRGEVTFESGKTIPKGRINIQLEDPASQDAVRRSAAQTSVASDGTLQTVAFSLALPARMRPSPTLQIVARLERADGWLLARGSATVDIDRPVSITLHTAMY